MNDNTPNWVRELVGRGKMKGKVEFLDAKGRPRRYIDGVAVKIPEAELVNLRKSLQKKTMTTVGPLQKMTASGVKGIQITRGEKLFGVGEDPAKKLADAMNAAYSPKAKPPSKATIEGMVKRMAALSPTDRAKVMFLRRAATKPVPKKLLPAKVNVRANPNGTVVSRAFGRGKRAAVHLRKALVADASVRMSNVVRRWKTARDTANEMGGKIDTPKEVGNLLRGKPGATSRIVDAWKRKKNQATFALMGGLEKLPRFQ